MTTLADLTPEERTQCKGLWCSYETPIGNCTAILYNFPLGDIREKESVLFDPKRGYARCKNTRITLRNDLPRAWQADGTPPAGEWEHAEYLGDYKGMSGVYHLDGNPTHRRFVGEWEEA